MDNQQNAFDFAWLLRNIGLAAMDKLVACLKELGSLGAARLACCALRDAVDWSMQELHITVLPKHLDMDTPGQHPSLERWPRCSSLDITVSEEAARVVGCGGVASLLLLPFTNASPERRHNITRLSCEVMGLDSVEITCLPSLPTWVPYLRELQLHKLPLECDPLMLGLMYEAFASLTHLETLTLPCFAALEGISALGGSIGSSSNNGPRLRRLEVCETTNTSLEPQALSGLSQLRALEHLNSVSYVHLTPGPGSHGSVNIDAAYSFFTADFAPSVECLEMRCYLDDYCGLVMKMGLCQGEMRSIDISPGVTLPGLLDMTVGILLPSLEHGPRSSRQQLERLSIDLIDVMPIGEPDERLVDDMEAHLQALQPLVHLRQRCRRCELMQLCLFQCPQSREGTAAAALLETAWRVAQILGPPQWVLELRVTPRVVESNDTGQHLHSRNSALRIWVGCCQTVLTGAAASNPGWQRPFLLPDDTPSAVMQEALQRMADQAQSAMSAAVAGAGCEAGGVGSCSGGEYHHQTELLLMRGPFVASLCQTPDTVVPWLRLLEYTAVGGGGKHANDVRHPYVSTERTAFSGVGGRQGASKRIRAYQLVPCAGALLLACEAASVQAVIEAAATATHLQHELAGQAAACQLDALPLGIRWTWGERDEHGTLCKALQASLLYNIAQVIEDELAQGVAVGLQAGAGGCQLTRNYMAWAQRVQDHVSLELPPALVI